MFYWTYIEPDLDVKIKLKQGLLHNKYSKFVNAGRI